MEPELRRAEREPAPDGPGGGHPHLLPVLGPGREAHEGPCGGVITLLLTIVISVLVYRMPLSAALSASALGMVTGLFPIGWIILTAVFLFNLTVESGQFEVIKSSISSLSPDRRIQALLIAFSFSAFMEGVAGQGAPVAVAAAMLIGLGFPALPAAVICLVANTPPVPFGPVGVPTMMMSTVTGIPATHHGPRRRHRHGLHGADHPLLHAGGHGGLQARQGSAARGPGGRHQLRRRLLRGVHLLRARTAGHHGLRRSPWSAW